MPTVRMVPRPVIDTTSDSIQLASQVAALLKERRYRKGEIIFHQGDPGGCLYLIIDGRVQIYLSNTDGRETTVRIYGCDTAFGEFSVLDGKPRSASAAALTDVHALLLYREDFLALLEANFALVQWVIATLTERLRYTTNYAENLAFLSVSGRIAAVLLQLASVENNGHDGARLHITQQTLAQATNTTCEWVNRTLADFATAGLVRLECGVVEVLNRSGLQRRVR